MLKATPERHDSALIKLFSTERVEQASMVVKLKAALQAKTISDVSTWVTRVFLHVATGC